MSLIELAEVAKRFGTVEALRGVSFAVEAGTVVGLVGDNGAGKSTLMKCITGIYRADAGTIRFAGAGIDGLDPGERRRAGIEMIYQDFALCGNMDVAANMFLGRWPTKGWFVDKRGMENEARQVLQNLRVEIPSVKLGVERVSGGRQQLVAIARAISFNPKVVILDEPTANLSVPATERLLELMLDLKKHGVAQIIISHRLQDIFAVGDRVMVLKRGRGVGERQIRETSEDEVLGLIVQGDAAEQTARE